MFAKERQKGTEESAGYDLYVAEAKTIMPGKNNLVSLDFRWAIPKGFCGRIVPRSSLIKENNVTVEAGQLLLCVCDSRSLCVCVFMLFHVLVSSGFTTSVIYVRCSDQRSFVVSISWVLLPSSFISISESILFHLQRRKLQPLYYWRENDMI